MLFKIRLFLKGPNYEITTYAHEDLFYDKAKLLENGDRYTKINYVNVNLN